MATQFWSQDRHAGASPGRRDDLLSLGRVVEPTLEEVFGLQEAGRSAAAGGKNEVRRPARVRVLMRVSQRRKPSGASDLPQIPSGKLRIMAPTFQVPSWHELSFVECVREFLFVPGQVHAWERGKRHWQ
ncbi:MAG: hypothetical protein U0638_05380 [Phycisphaerales bacterium]